MADTQVETILLAPSTSSQQPADLLQILSNTPSSSSSSSSAVVASNNNITSSSSSNTTAVDTTNQQIQNLLCKSEPEPIVDEGEPETKRRRKTSPAGQIHEKLESRLNGILCCAVCLDLPKTAIYQVGTSLLSLSH